MVRLGDRGEVHAQEDSVSGLDFTLKLHRTGKGQYLVFDIDRAAHNDAWDYLNTIGAKTNDYFRVRVEKPFKGITKGHRGQLPRHWGHCTDIAEQLSTDRQMYSKEDIDAALRRMAVSEGLRTYLSIDGHEEPIHLSEMSVEDAAIVERVKARYCDTNDLFLSEYRDPDDPSKGVYRSLGGRTYDEMLKWWEERGA
jgi:hypothetical protein